MRRLHWPTWSLGSSLFGAAFAVSACSGEIGEGPGGRPQDPGNPTAGSGGGQMAPPPSAGQGPAQVPGSGGTSSSAGQAATAGSGVTPPVVDPPEGPRDAGRVTMRRLNRAEYDNTVRDLLGTAQTPARSFLNDAPQFGFDNNADHLTLSPTQLGMYQQAAEALAGEAITGAARARLVTCDLATGDACVRSVVTSFGLRAYRRPLQPSEIDGFVALAAKARAAGATADEAIRTVVEAVLVSPHFLFRVELDPDPASAEAHPVTSYEMASRLSYLVFRSMPDPALFEAAAANRLSQPAELRDQLTRLLAQPAGKTFAQDFVGQWLGTRLLETAQFDPDRFPSFSAALASSMRSEVIAFFDEFVREDRPVRELITANFSYLDDNLARHYKLPLVGAGGLKRSMLASPERAGGLLTMAGPLAVTSYPTRTSVVKRGHWVMQELLCAEPPPPPPDVDGFPEGAMNATTQRKMLELHRANPSCNGCHVEMDNIGLALENYDAIGAYRTMEGGAPVDAKGVLLNGVTFEGAVQLARVLADDERFAPCVAEHMLKYALGRSISASDAPYIREIASGTLNAVGVRQILMNIVASDTFRMRRGEPANSTGAQP